MLDGVLRHKTQTKTATPTLCTDDVDVKTWSTLFCGPLLLLFHSDAVDVAAAAAGSSHWSYSTPRRRPSVRPSGARPHATVPPTVACPRRTSAVGVDQWRACGIHAALSDGRRRPIADDVEPFPPQSATHAHSPAPAERLHCTTGRRTRPQQADS